MVDECREEYLNYIDQWQIHHADPVFYGSTPLCYEDWKAAGCPEG